MRVTLSRVATPSRRLHARYLCCLTAKLSCALLKEPVEATLLNLGMGGTYLKVKAVLPLADVKLDVAQGRDVLGLNGKVIRDAGPDPKDSKCRYYGVEFILDKKTEFKVRMLVDRVRSSMDPSINLPMTNYWNR